jgi:hypothetical protein
MARKRSRSTPAMAADRVLEPPETTVLDLLDNLLNKGVLASGDLVLGVAGVDLIYLRLSTVLCAADRILPPTLEEKKTRRSRHHVRGGLLGRR